MKKQLLFLLTFCLSAIGYSQVFTDNYITYEVTSTTTNTVKTQNYNPAGGLSVSIPNTVTNPSTSITYSVTEIGSFSFNGDNLTSVNIPNSVTIISSYAFLNCNLSSVVIPTSVTSIGESAFSQNVNLSSVTLHNGITSIGANAFNVCALTSINIPTSMTTIEDGTFANNNLTSVSIPNNITSIGQYAFRFNSIVNLSIPDSVLTIENLAFNSNALTSLNLGNGVQVIGNEAFRYNNGLQTLIIPASVTNIGNQAFSLFALTDVTSLATTPPTITTGTNDTFGSIANRGNINLHIPPGTTGAYVTNSGALWTGFASNTEDALSTSNFEIDNDVKIITTENSIKIVASNQLQFENYTIYNLSGQEITKGIETEIETTSFSSGIYILNLNFDKGSVVKKVLIK